MSLTKLGPEWQNYIIIGEDDDGNRYRLNLKQIIAHSYDRVTEVVVELPFSADHKIWKELYND